MGTTRALGDVARGGGAPGAPGVSGATAALAPRGASAQPGSA
jgi:hypothetical protein